MKPFQKSMNTFGITSWSVVLALVVVTSCRNSAHRSASGSSSGEPEKTVAPPGELVKFLDTQNGTQFRTTPMPDDINSGLDTNASDAGAKPRVDEVAGDDDSRHGAIGESTGMSENPPVPKHGMRKRK